MTFPTSASFLYKTSETAVVRLFQVFSLTDDTVCVCVLLILSSSAVTLIFSILSFPTCCQLASPFPSLLWSRSFPPAQNKAACSFIGPRRSNVWMWLQTPLEGFYCLGFMLVTENVVVKLETCRSKHVTTAGLCPQNCHLNQQELIKRNL